MIHLKPIFPLFEILQGSFKSKTCRRKRWEREVSNVNKSRMNFHDSFYKLNFLFAKNIDKIIEFSNWNNSISIYFNQRLVKNKEGEKDNHFVDHFSRTLVEECMAGGEGSKNKSNFSIFILGVEVNFLQFFFEI